MGATWSRDQAGMNDGFDCEAAEAITAGQLITVRTNGGDDLAYVACASAPAADLPAMGIALYDVADGEVGHFKFAGLVTDLDVVCVDGYYYLSNTPGAFSATAGTTSQIVAKAIAGAAGAAILDFQNVAHNHVADS